MAQIISRLQLIRTHDKGMSLTRSRIIEQDLARTPTFSGGLAAEVLLYRLAAAAVRQNEEHRY